MTRGTTNIALDEDALRRLLRCWGKTGAQGDGPSVFHPAVYHMLDAANVADQLLSPAASPRWRRILAAALDAPADHLATWLPFFVALHDIGKISVPFQSQNQAQKARLKAEGFDFHGWMPALSMRHSVVSHIFLESALRNLGLAEVPAFLHTAWCNMASGHHGKFASTACLREAESTLNALEPQGWAQMRLQAACLLSQTLLLEPPAVWPRPLDVSAAAMVLAGFTTLCDWLASDSQYFCPAAAVSWADYLDHSRNKALERTRDAGFHEGTASRAPAVFSLLFADIQSARPLQTAIYSIPDDLLERPTLTIMEAPTGEGKTEAALALAHRIAQKTGCDELYYALPTTATSNQMWVRLKTHLQQRLALPGDVKLIHGQAFLLQDDLVVKPLADDDGEQEAMLEWFAPKKRSLLAPFGVGTVDQAELGALNVPYVTLRLVGLAGKVVIFDEVHAYDTYMTTVVERLLEWLAAVGTSVIILSATLPNSRRQALVRAFSGTELTAPDSDAYPCLWVVGPSHSHFAAPRAYQSNRTLELHVLNLAHGEPAAKAQWLLDTVATGGCACWLTNTVRRAQDIYAALRVMAPPGVDLTLIHSQFPLEDREAIETLIQERYGPGGARRPASGIVVGTQVLEQSLDLDFDVMVTDLAPVDLVLQRAGRLHRHQRNRPKAHDSPRLWLNVPEAEDGNPSLAGDRHVYDEFILHITWRMLRERSQINLPADYRALVEAVYAADPPGHDDPLARAWEELAKKQADARAQARIRLLPPPDPSSVFCPDAAALQFQEDEEGSGWIVAKTRLGEDTVNVIPLERHGHVAVVGQQQLDLHALPDRQTQFRLLRRSLRISHPAAVRALKEVSKDRPPCFKRAARLKGYQPLWLENGQAKLTWQGKTLVLTLDPALGLRVASASEGG